MLRFWSEVPTARLREVAADVATWAWVALWVVVSSRIYVTIVDFARAGRVLREGGTNIQAAGVDLGGSVAGMPLIGADFASLTTDAFRIVGEPLIFAGRELEQLLVMIATLLGLLVLAVMLIPWLSRYVPWRARRLYALRAADRAIRRSKNVPEGSIQRLLASRALHRMSWPELLEETPDPLGDFATGRYDRLARAELASVGLRPR